MTDVRVQNGHRVARKVLVHMRLPDADREEYGGPEWVAFDPEYLEDVRSDVLIGIERDARDAGEPVALLTVLTDPLDLGCAAVKAKLLIARRQAGCVDSWATFQPRLAAVRYRVEPVFDQPVEGADPLVDGSATSPITPVAEPSPTG